MLNQLVSDVYIIAVVNQHVVPGKRIVYPITKSTYVCSYQGNDVNMH